MYTNLMNIIKLTQIGNSIKNQPKKKRVYNLKIEKIDKSKLDHFMVPIVKTLPDKVDLRNSCGPIYDQGNIGSCTANAFCGLLYYKRPTFLGSRLFLYYNERRLEGSINYDSGATLYDGIKSLLINGVCLEKNWVYNENKFAIKPPNSCYIEALKYKVKSVKNIDNTLINMKSSLVNKQPFVVGIAVYESFESNTVASTGLVPMPQPNEQLLGGHAILIVGYDDIKKVWIARNSWGSSWGDKGYFYLPYNYLIDDNLASDLWTIITF